MTAPDTKKNVQDTQKASSINSKQIDETLDGQYYSSQCQGELNSKGGFGSAMDGDV